MKALPRELSGPRPAGAAGVPDGTPRRPAVRTQARDAETAESPDPAFETRLRAIVTAAASYEDRTRTESFVPCETEVCAAVGSAAVDEALEWLDRAAATPEEAAALVGHLSAADRPLAAAVGPVRLREGAPLPDWAAALRTFVRAQPERRGAAAEFGVNGHGVNGHGATGARTAGVGVSGTAAPGSVPLRSAAERAAAALLPRDAGSVCGVAVGDAAWSGMASWLAHRLDEVCRAVLREERNPQAGPARSAAAPCPGNPPAAPRPPDLTRDGWLDRFEAYPGLARLVGTACRQWRDALGELLARLAQDREVLRAELWGGAQPGALTEFRLGSGDRHADGRSVALLGFAGGHGVVYKPKDMRHAAAFMQLVSFLNSRDPNADLPVHAVVVRDGYGWAQRIVPRPDRDDEGARGLHRRFGAFVRLFHLLGGQDMRIGDLLADGDRPVFTDVGSLLAPLSPDGARCTPLAGTVVPLALLHQPWRPPDDGTPYDADCPSAASPSPSAPPSPSLSACPSPAGERADPAGRALPSPASRRRPAGNAVDPVRYAADVVQGYAAMQRTLARAHTELALPDGPLAGFRDVPVRCVRRANPDRRRILEQSLHPRHLRTGTGRDLALAGLLRGPLGRADLDACRPGPPDPGIGPDAALEPDPDLDPDVDLRFGSGLDPDPDSDPGSGLDPGLDPDLDLALAEIDALNRLDLPLLCAVTTSRSVVAADGREIPGYSPATGWDRLQQRVAELERFALREHADLVTACLDAASGGTPLPPQRMPLSLRRVPRPGGARPPGPAGGPSRLSERRLLAAAVRIGDEVLAARRGGAGRAGWIGLTWYPVTGLRQVEVLGTDLLGGIGGIAVLLADLWAATGEARFGTAAREVLESGYDALATSIAHAPGRVDRRVAGRAPVPGGFAGPGAFVHALARCAQTLGDPGLIEPARELAPAAVALVRPGESYADLPVGAAGLLLNLLRLRRAAAAAGAGVHPATDEAIGSLVRIVQAEADRPRPAKAVVGPLADLAPVGADSMVLALARALAQAPDLVDAGALRAAVAAHRFDTAVRGGRLALLDTAIALGGGLDAPLCREPAEPGAMSGRRLVAEAGERLLAREAGRQDATANVAPLLAELFARHEATGRWLPDRLAADRTNLHALDGLVAVGLLLVHCAEPTPAPLAVLR